MDEFIMNTLYVVATPIGNLEDFSFRALRILSEVDLILCEDTRITKKLLDHYRINKPTLSYHEHSDLKKVDYILGLLRKGKNLALVSDAGTPSISDPGGKLIKLAVESLGNSVRIVPIPGASAVTTAISISGFPMNKFIFMGFPPVKKKRKKFFEEIISSKYPVVFYESPYRIIKTLNELNSLYTKYSIINIKIAIGRELTKKFETIYRGNIEKVIESVKNNIIKGEFVVIVGTKSKKV